MPERLAATWLPRAPVVVFAAVEAFALVLWMAAGRFLWFYLDDWDFLAARRTGNLGDLFRPHNEHWTTVPILIYRVLFHIYGVNTYFPYRLVGVVIYLALAALLFVSMRRIGVHPWIACVVASRYALYGAGAQNIVRPFQMTFNGALVFGLLHLLLADHDGPFDRRDRIGLAAGFVGLMMSGVAVPMVIAVGIAVLWRRGWRMALLHTAPLGVTYSVWWLAIGHTGSVLKVGPQKPVTTGTVFGFVESGLRGAFSGLGHVKGFGTLLFVLFVVGLPLAWITRSWPAPHERDPAGDRRSVPLGAAGRAGRSGRARGRGRRVPRRHRARALVVRRGLRVDRPLRVDLERDVGTRDRRRRRRASAQRRVLLIAGLAILLLGIQPNLVDNFGPHSEFLQGDAATRIMMLTIPRDPVAGQVPRSLRPRPCWPGPSPSAGCSTASPSIVSRRRAGSRGATEFQPIPDVVRSGARRRADDQLPGRALDGVHGFRQRRRDRCHRQSAVHRAGAPQHARRLPAAFPSRARAPRFRSSATSASSGSYRPRRRPLRRSASPTGRPEVGGRSGHHRWREICGSPGDARTRRAVRWRRREESNLRQRLCRPLPETTRLHRQVGQHVSWPTITGPSPNRVVRAVHASAPICVRRVELDAGPPRRRAGT